MPVSFCLAGFNAVFGVMSAFLLFSQEINVETPTTRLYSRQQNLPFMVSSASTLRIFFDSSHCWPSWQPHVSDCTHALHRLPDSHSSSMDSLSASGSAVPQHFRDCSRLLKWNPASSSTPHNWWKISYWTVRKQNKQTNIVPLSRHKCLFKYIICCFYF